MANVQPRFEVYPVEKEGLTRKICKPMKDGGFTYEEVPETRECFDVYFPGGHSVRIHGREELARLGYTKAPDLVDMDTGDVIARGQTSLKEMAQRTTKVSKPKGMTDG